MKYLLNKISAAVFFVSVVAFSACQTNEETFSEFSNLGETVYVGLADSVMIASGYEQVRVSIIINADPKIAKGILKSADETIDMEFDVQRKNNGTDTLNIDLSNVKEGDYRFYLHFEDANGNKSLQKEFTARVVGADYVKTLTKKEVSTVSYTQGDNGEVGARITFGKNVDKLREMRIEYTNREGMPKSVVVGAKAPFVELFDFDGGTHFKAISVFDPVNPFQEFTIEDDGTGVDDEEKFTFPTCDEVATVTFASASVDMGNVNSRESAVASFEVNPTVDCLDGDVTLTLDRDTEWFGISTDMAGPFGSSVSLSDLSVANTIYVEYKPNSQVDATHKDTVRLSASKGYLADAYIAVEGSETGIPGGVVRHPVAERAAASDIFTDDLNVYQHGTSVENLWDDDNRWPSANHSAGGLPVPVGFFTVDLSKDYKITEISWQARGDCCQNRSQKKYQYWGLPASVDPASAVTTTDYNGKPENTSAWELESLQKGWVPLGNFELDAQPGGSDTITDKIGGSIKVRYLRLVILETFEGNTGTVNFGTWDFKVDLDAL